MYRGIVKQLTIYAVENEVKSFTGLRAAKYHETRDLHPELPSHYIYTACQDAAARAKGFLRLKKRGHARGDRPEIRRVSIWLDDHLWAMEGYTSIRIAIPRGWLEVELEPHRQYWKYVNGGWRIASGARIKLDRRNRRLRIYLTFVGEVDEYELHGFVSVDVNENNVTALVGGAPYLLETNVARTTLGYYYRRRRIQGKYGELYGPGSRAERKVMGRLGEREKRDDARTKVAKIIVGAAQEMHGAVVLEELGDRPARGMISRIKNRQLRHRIFQAAFKGIQRAIDEETIERGVPIIHVDPRNTSRFCPVHDAPIIYERGSRVGRCSAGGERWHRDAAAVWNIYIRAGRGDGSDAPSPGSPTVDGNHVPLGSTAAHTPWGSPGPFV